MIDFIIKSTISLGILYLFYKLFLSGIKTFKFNRCYLLGSLIFSLLIPLISIPIESNVFPLTESTGILTVGKTVEYTAEFVGSNEQKYMAVFEVLPYIFLAVTLILFLRFGLNLFSIINQIRINEKIHKQFYILVLNPDKTPPHTFLNYILVNRVDYLAGNLDQTLLDHEASHCRQWHSLDILFVELLKTAFWINPFILQIKKAIQLNHEFLADEAVLSTHSISQYKNTLVSMVLKNNGGLLVSNFNFSYTKQRLKMMTKQVTPLRAAFGKTAALFLFLAIAMTISCQKEIIEPDILSNSDVEWWEPILKEHNIEPEAYNNFPHVFEMGTTNSINDGVVSLENAFFLFRPVDFHSKEIDENSYIMLEAPFATHDLNTDSIKTDHGKIRMFELKEGKITSVNQYTFSKMKMFVNEKKFYFSVDEVTSQEIKLSTNKVNREKYHYNMSVRW